MQMCAEYFTEVGVVGSWRHLVAGVLFILLRLRSEKTKTWSDKCPSRVPLHTLLRLNILCSTSITAAEDFNVCFHICSPLLHPGFSNNKSPFTDQELQVLLRKEKKKPPKQNNSFPLSQSKCKIFIKSYLLSPISLFNYASSTTWSLKCIILF